MDQAKQKKYCFPLSSPDLSAKQLVGERALRIQHALQAKVPMAKGFVISGAAFDDYLIANSLIDDLLNALEQSLDADKNQLKQISAKITDQILGGTIPNSLANAITKSYQGLSSFTTAVVNVQQSELLPELAAQNYQSEPQEVRQVSGIDEVLQAIKTVWAGLFSPDALAYRNNIQYEGSLSQPVVVSLQPTAEVAGALFNFDVADGVQTNATVLAVYGNPLLENLSEKSNSSREEAALNIPDADYYLVNKAGGAQLKKSQRQQRFMYVAAGPNAPQQYAKVKLSALWSQKPKLDEIQLSKLTAIVRGLEQVTDAHYLAEWVLTGGVFTVTAWRELTPEYAAGLGFNWEQQVPQQPGLRFRISTGREGVTPPQAKEMPSAKTFGVDLEKLTAAAETVRSEKADAVKSMLPEVKTVTEVWWSYPRPASELKVFSHNLDGYGVLTWEEILEEVAPDYEEGKSQLSPALQKKICEHLALYALAIAPKPLVIKLNARASFEAQVQVLNQLRGAYGHRNFWLILPELANLSELSMRKRELTSAGFRRTANFKLFQVINQPLFLANLPELREQGIDGVLVDLDSLYKRTAASGDFKQLADNLPLFQSYILSQLTAKNKLHLFTVATTKNKLMLESLLEPLLEIGVNGLVYPWIDLYEFKQNLTKQESQILTKSLKKLKKRLNKL